MALGLSWYSKSFKNKLVSTTLAIFFVVYFLTLQWSYLAISSELLDAAEKESTSTSAILVMALYRAYDLSTDKREILSFLHGSKKYRDNLVLIRVFDLNQTVISSSSIEEIGQTLIFDKHQTPLLNEVASEMDWDSGLLTIYHPVSAGEGEKYKPIGFIEARYDIETLKSALGRLQWLFVLGGFLMALLITFALSKIATSVTRPMRTLHAAMMKVKDEQLDIRVPVTSADEVGFLSHKFNVMIESLSNSRMRLKQMLDASIRFVPAEFLQMLGCSEIGQVALGDARHRNLTVMFVDIRDFTKLSSTLSADEVLAFVNRINHYLIPVIQKHHGFVDKFIGDAIMAIFPRTPDDAVLASRELFDALASFNEDEQSSGQTNISIGVGLNCGDVIIGTVGSEARMDTTVIGDTVNLASRMEGLTKNLGIRVLMAKNVYQKLQLNTIEQSDISALGKHSVKGIARPIEIYGIDC